MMNLKRKISLTILPGILIFFLSCQQNNQPQPTPQNNGGNGNTNNTTQSWGQATPYPNPNGTVNSMAVFNNELYICGDFTQVGGIVANKVAKWNGTSWSALSTPTGTGSVRSMIIYNNSIIIVQDGDLKKWNGNSWDHIAVGLTIGPNLIGMNMPMCVHNGQLVVCGGLSDTAFNYFKVAFVNSNYNWTPLPNLNHAVYSVCYYSNELYAGGDGISKWDGSNWIDVSGVTASTPAIACMCVFNNKLVVGGNINSIGGITTYDLVQYDGVQWTNVSFQNGLPGFTSGSFDFCYLDGGNAYFHAPIGYWSGSYYYRIFSWNGSQWTSLGNNGLQGAVRCIIKFNNEIYIGGQQLYATLPPYANLLKLN